MKTSDQAVIFTTAANYLFNTQDFANPNLFQLGIFHLLLDILATAGYLYLTIIRFEWFKGYMSGITAGVGTLVSCILTSSTAIATI